MLDQATQLRQLIRDVKSNPSPRVALPPIVGVASAQASVATAEIAFELAAALAAMHRRVLLVGADPSYCRPNVNEFLSIAAVSEAKNLLHLHEAGHLPVSENTEMIIVDAEALTEANWLRHARQIVLAMPPTSSAIVESYTCVKKLSEAGDVNHKKIRPVLSEYVPRTVASKLLEQFDSTCYQFLNLQVAEGYVLAGVDRQQTLQATAALAHELAIECLATTLSYRPTPRTSHSEGGLADRGIRPEPDLGQLEYKLNSSVAGSSVGMTGGANNRIIRKNLQIDSTPSHLNDEGE